jgi:hypothetical protein
VFNDATTKLIGGVYDGTQNDGNRQSILTDLNATRTGLSDLLGAHPEQFQGATGKHVQQIVDLLGKEIGAVEAAGSAPQSATQINTIHRSIVGIVDKDPGLKALATDGDAVGFAPLPDANGAKHIAQGPAIDPGMHGDVASGHHGNGPGGQHLGFEHFWG